jgi:hypothetical protein
MLDDDGTLAGMFGIAHAPANPPEYLRVDYTYVAPSPSGNEAISTPSVATVFTTRARQVGSGVKYYVEAVIHSVAPGFFDDMYLDMVESVGMAPTFNTIHARVRNRSGAIEVSTDDALFQAISAPIVGYRIGMVFDGNTGDVTWVSADGVLNTVSAKFAPGNNWTQTLRIKDAGGPTSATAGQTCSIELVVAAADMVLPGSVVGFPAGCTDFYGDPV